MSAPPLVVKLWFCPLGYAPVPDDNFTVSLSLSTTVRARILTKQLKT